MDSSTFCDKNKKYWGIFCKVRWLSGCQLSQCHEHSLLLFFFFCTLCFIDSFCVYLGRCPWDGCNAALSRRHIEWHAQHEHLKRQGRAYIASNKLSQKCGKVSFFTSTSSDSLPNCNWEECDSVSIPQIFFDKYNILLCTYALWLSDRGIDLMHCNIFYWMK